MIILIKLTLNTHVCNIDAGLGYMSNMLHTLPTWLIKYKTNQINLPVHTVAVSKDWAPP